ncbi:RES family NAD+ phosphorylase [Streptomyces sp. NPDC056580]|uniref:RES family NAD+ phosphorylase n=1 Tax=Streptomyces sp. NPDC056580 TaxID=3345872 RepID=UPI00369321D9
MTTPAVTCITAPEAGVWRLGWAHDPIRYNQVEPETFSGSSAGRFSLFSYGMLYCATDLAGCFAEALAHFRVDPFIRSLMSDAEHNSDLMGIGQVPSSWRDARILVRLMPPRDARFLDVDSDETRKVLAAELEIELSKWGVAGSLTDEHIHGKDRRIARQIAAWAVAQRNDAGHQLFQGIAYQSGYGGRQCWSILHDTPLTEVERRDIRVEAVELQEVAREYGLTVR